MPRKRSRQVRVLYQPYVEQVPDAYPMYYQPQPEMINVPYIPYGCGKCQKRKFGGEEPDKKSGVKSLAKDLYKGIHDSYVPLFNSFHKDRLENAVLHGLKLPTYKKKKPPVSRK